MLIKRAAVLLLWPRWWQLHARRDAVFCGIRADLNLIKCWLEGALCAAMGLGLPAPVWPNFVGETGPRALRRAPQPQGWMHSSSHPAPEGWLGRGQSPGTTGTVADVRGGFVADFGFVAFFFHSSRWAPAPMAPWAAWVAWSPIT